MARNVNTRIISKHDTEANWNKAEHFVPEKGEIIIYDADATNPKPRIKVGNNEQLPKDLAFVGSDIEITNTVEEGSQKAVTSGAVWEVADLRTEIAEQDAKLAAIAEALQGKTWVDTLSESKAYTDKKIAEIGGGGGGTGGGGSIVSLSNVATTGTRICTITIDGTATDIKAPTSGGGGGTGTDSNVEQTNSTTNSNFKLLFTSVSGTDTSSPGTTTALVSEKIYANPSTGTLTASKVNGAVWNDYAEYRIPYGIGITAGRVVVERGDDSLELSSERLQPGANIVSDTFGFSIGETKEATLPIAMAGRVLAYPYEAREEFKPGDAVCAGPNGTVSRMSREEIKEYPERIIGTVSAVPSYETWGENEIKVDGRIWIKI